MCRLSIQTCNILYMEIFGKIMSRYNDYLLNITVPCGDSLTQVSSEYPIGKFMSPNFPDKYYDELFCRWIISSPDFTRLLLEVTNIDIERRFDYLRIGQGNDSANTSSTWLEITGKLPSLSAVSPTNAVWLVFTSDYSVRRRGFLVEYTLVDETGE